MRLRNLSILTIATAAALSVFPLTQAFCQESAAGQEMHQSGQAIKSAGSETGESVKHAYRGTADQLSDAALTTKVKSVLLSDARTRKYSIHVESDEGKVTLDGAVESPSDAKYARTVVASVHGVRAVHNKLTWPTSLK
jgi:hyperosmotically inducible protein